MNTILDSTLFAACLFLGMLAFLELGLRAGRRRMVRDPEGVDKGTGAIEGAVFALFGLLLAFTFSGAASRFDHRRDLIMQEANAIGTAYLRVDLLPPATQPKIRLLFREYVEARLATYRDVADATATSTEYERSSRLQHEIWTLSVSAAGASPTPTVSNLVLPSLNDMFDIATTRLAATRTHPPAVVFAMLFGLGLAVSLLAGYGMVTSRTRRLLHSLVFSTVISATVYVIMDMEYPRLGLIRVDSADQLLRDVLRGMQ